MKEMTIKSRAKINLTLDVFNKREDGYHNIETIMQTIDLSDAVHVKIGENDGIKIKTNISFLPEDSGNIAYKAAEVFFRETAILPCGVSIDIHKRIPVAAGLAGGSTNAASVLLALNKLCETNMSLEDLVQIGVKIGADVPYCLRGGTMLAEGIGEKLTAIDSMPECMIVLCKPSFSISTPYMYSKIDYSKIEKHPDTRGMVKALSQGDYIGVCRRMYNVMEDVARVDHREIADIRDVLLDSFADGAIMSGSGPTVFGMFSDIDKCETAYAKLRAFFKETYITKVSNFTNNA